MADETIEGRSVQATEPNLTGVGPSSIKTVDHLAQVMVDQWGHRGEYVKGMIINRNDLNPAHYDWEHATQRSGALRLLTEAEARSQPTTTPVGFGDDERAAVRYNAGIVDDAETVTTEQGMAEPEEFSKPTLPGPANNTPAARPVRVASAEDARAAGGTRRTVATPAGPVYERQSDRDAASQRASSKAVAPAPAAETESKVEG